MRKAIFLCGLALFGLAFALAASDPWDKKPFQQWSEKDVERILKNSPWAKQVTLILGMPSPGGGGGAGGGRRGRGTGGSTVGGGMETGGETAGGGGMAAGGSADRGAGSGSPTGAAPPPSITTVIRWQSALPIKQALAKAKYGAEVDSIPQVKELLTREETHYVIALLDLPRGLSRLDPAKVQQALKDITLLAIKGKEALRPEMIQLLPGEKSAAIFFAFPRAKAITLADKEVEFSTHIGTLDFKKKFKLQDMVFDGKLEL
jgi:hypothetical protein